MQVLADEFFTWIQSGTEVEEKQLDMHSHV